MQIAEYLIANLSMQDLLWIHAPKAQVVTAMEWVGSIAGLLGAFLLATHTHISRYGWVAFLMANLTMGAFALMIDRHGLLLQQIGFTATSLLGMYRAGFFAKRHQK